MSSFRGKIREIVSYGVLGRKIGNLETHLILNDCEPTCSWVKTVAEAFNSVKQCLNWTKRIWNEEFIKTKKHIILPLLIDCILAPPCSTRLLQATTEANVLINSYLMCVCRMFWAPNKNHRTLTQQQNNLRSLCLQAFPPLISANHCIVANFCRRSNLSNGRKVTQITLSPANSCIPVAPFPVRSGLKS